MLTLAPGLKIPTFSRQGTYQHWNRFAAVNDEYADHHMDDEVGKYEGFTAAIGMAPLTLSYVQAMLREWLADEGRIVSVTIRLRSPFLRGRTVTLGGEVRDVQREDDELVAGCEVWVDDDEGVRIVVGEAKVAVPA